MKMMLMLLLCGWWLCGTAMATEVPQAVAERVDEGSLYGALPDEASGLLNGQSPTQAGDWQGTLGHLGEEAGSQLGGAVKNALKGLLVILAVLLLCGVFNGLTDDEQASHAGVQMAGALTIGAVSLTQAGSLLQLGQQALQSLQTFSASLLPVMTTVSVASGQPVSAAAKQSATVLFGGLLMSLIQGLLLPLLMGFLALSVARAALGHEALGKVAQLMRWIATRLLLLLLGGYTLFLTLTGVLAGATEGLALKGTKALINAVPVVGGVASGAAESVMAGAAMVKSALGVFGLLALLAVVLVPMVQLLAAYLVYKIGAAVAPTMASSRLAALVEDLAQAFGLLVGMVGAGVLLNLLSVLAMMKGGGL